MGIRLFLILLMAAVISYNGNATGSALSALRTSWLKPVAALKQGATQEEKSKERKADVWQCKGVLVRSFRLRSRLNTHLLKLRFRM